MNQLTQNQNTATVIFDDQKGREAFTMANLVFNPQAMQAVNNLACMLADNSGMVPTHFSGKPGDLMGVIMQAGRWGMDPIAVAQSTFVLQGKIGYEAKLMQAVAKANGGIDFDPEYYGDWSRIQGNIKKQKKQLQGKNGPYTKDVDSQGWTHEEEKAVGIRLSGAFPDGRTKVIDIPLCTCYPRNSTNWIFDPQQQIYYTAVKRWVRRFAPHLGLGIQDYDDIAARNGDAQEREINPTRKASSQQVKKAVEPESLDDILGGEVAEAQQVNAEVEDPQGLDDILGGETPSYVGENGEYIPTKYDEMIDMLHSVSTADDYWSTRSNCVEVINSNALDAEQVKNIKLTLNTLRETLGIPEAQK